MDSWSSLQLYAAIVGVTTVIAMSLLESGPKLPSSESTPTTVEAAPNAGSNRTAAMAAASTGDAAASGPFPMSALPKLHQQQQQEGRCYSEPQWYIFKWVNLVAVIAFFGVLFHISLQSHTTTYATDDTTILSTTTTTPSSSPLLWQFIVVWSIFLYYCLGFFGVSLVHDSMRSTSATSDVHVLESMRPSSEPQRQLRLSNMDEMVPETIRIPNQAVPSFPSEQKEIPSTSQSEETNAKSLPLDTTAAVPTSVIKDSSDDDDDDVIAVANLVLQNKLRDHDLERVLDPFRAVRARRLVVQHKLAHFPTEFLSTANNTSSPLDGLPWLHSLDYSRVLGANCESVVGYVPIPVGIVGPLVVNDESVYVPMATTEGCLVASTNRGAKAIALAGGAHAEIVRDGITRAPCLRLPSAREAARVKIWCETPDNFALLQKAFESTTSFGKLKGCEPTIAGRNLYLRLVCFSGDAMGMNMVSKGSLAVIECLKDNFPLLQLVALSGNMCSDKKAAAINWIEGRGKSVVVEATIPKSVVHTVLKTTVPALVQTNLHKNLIGSAMAGMAAGGFNAHASNIVTAVFLATGQDPAQNVVSSNCITLLEETEVDGDLWISCTMPSLEVGTVGGGTSLDAQAACLRVMACHGGSPTSPGANAQRLARIIAATTMAGELSLLAALAANTLVEAHLQHNRKK